MLAPSKSLLFSFFFLTIGKMDLPLIFNREDSIPQYDVKKKNFKISSRQSYNNFFLDTIDRLIYNT